MLKKLSLKKKKEIYTRMTLTLTSKTEKTKQENFYKNKKRITH